MSASPRFDPEVEFHLEELYRLSLVGDAPPNSLAIAWQEPHSGSVHTTDVAGLVDTTDGNPNSAKQVGDCRLTRGAHCTVPVIVSSLSVSIQVATVHY